MGDSTLTPDSFIVVCSEAEELRVMVVCVEAVRFDGEIVGSDFVCNMVSYREGTNNGSSWQPKRIFVRWS